MNFRDAPNKALSCTRSGSSEFVSALGLISNGITLYSNKPRTEQKGAFHLLLSPNSDAQGRPLGIRIWLKPASSLRVSESLAPSNISVIVWIERSWKGRGHCKRL